MLISKSGCILFCLLAIWERTEDDKNSFDIGLDVNHLTGTSENICYGFHFISKVIQ